ncbi:MAG: deoxyribose-phosphate aldolase [candidate division KSB1 bacterium]|nr:deoxyribose-phosphate aldolase [candidate division KSB1 bacterium]
MPTVKELAKMIDHSILHPTMTDEDLKRECEIAVKYDTASVCVKPYAVKQAAEYLKGSDVINGCVIGFPHGNSAIDVKVFETEQAIKDGAVEIDMVVNIGKVLSGDWDYVKKEIGSIVKVTKANHAVLKVIFENDYMPDDAHIIKLCEICSELKVDYVKTSSGFGFVKGEDGRYAYEGATEHDLRLMRKHSDPEVKVKAAGGVRTLNGLLMVRDCGAARCGATATVKILDDARQRFGG